MVRKVVVAWVLDLLKDVLVKDFLVGWTVVGLSVGEVADFLASYYHQFFVGN